MSLWLCLWVVPPGHPESVVQRAVGPPEASPCVSPSGCLLLWHFWLISVDPPPPPFFLNTLAKHLEEK